MLISLILVIFQFTCLLIFIVPSILGANSDFLQTEEAAHVELVKLEEAARTPENKHKTPEIMAEAETSPESTEEQQRPVRQSFSFSSFGPFSDSSRGQQQDEGLSFQRVRMGPGDDDRSVGFKVISLRHEIEMWQNNLGIQFWQGIFSIKLWYRKISKAIRKQLKTFQ